MYKSLKKLSLILFLLAAPPLLHATTVPTACYPVNSGRPIEECHAAGKEWLSKIAPISVDKSMESLDSQVKNANPRIIQNLAIEDARITFGWGFAQSIFYGTCRPAPEAVEIVKSAEELMQTSAGKCKELGVDCNVWPLEQAFPHPKTARIECSRWLLAEALKRKSVLEAETKKRQDAEQIKIAEETARKNAEYTAELTRINAGQLYALSDKYKNQGDIAKSREALNMLLTKYPNHALVATAAQQLSALSENNNTVTNQPNRADSSGNPSATSTFTGKSAFSSVCVRNLEKIQKEAEKAGRNQHWFSSDRIVEIQKLTAQVAEPCISSDERAKYVYDDNLKAARNTAKRCAEWQATKHFVQSGTVCSEWGLKNDIKQQETNRQYYAFMIPELNKALRDPNYSVDLESNKVSNNNARPPIGDGACTSELNKLSQQAETSRLKVPKTETVPVMEIVLWETQEAIKVIDKHCPTHNIQRTRRAELVKTNSTTQAACNGISARGACTARLYGGPTPVPAKPERRNDAPQNSSNQDTNCNSLTGANFRQCVGLVCQKAGGNLTAGKSGCITCITGKGNDFTQCVQGASGVGSMQ